MERIVNIFMGIENKIIFKDTLLTLKTIADLICKSFKQVLEKPTIVGPKTMARLL